MSSSPRHRYHVGRLLLTRTNELLALLAVGFILQAGLVPFDFQFGEVVNLPSPTSPLHDILGNLFLFVPFGVFVHAVFARYLTWLFAAFLTLLTAVLLSGGMEWVQAYSPSRVSSMVDVCCNVLGAEVGAVLSGVGKELVPRWIGAAMFEYRTRPAVAALKAYILILAVFAAIPFTFAFDAPRFKQAVQQSVIVPFGNTVGDESPKQSATVDWAKSRRWARWSAEAASFVLLAWLMQIVLRGDYGFVGRSATGMTLWMGGALGVGLSVGQFLVVTRGLDVTDVLFRWCGLGVGLISWSWVRNTATRGFSWMPCRAMAGAAAAWIVVAGLAPFQFASPEHGVVNTLNTAAFLPFMAYFQTRTDLMLTDVIEKVASYALLSGLLASTLKFRAFSSGWRLVGVSIVGVGLSTVIESAQFFLPARVVSLTDPILAAAGCLIGVLTSEHVSAMVRFILTHKIFGPCVVLPPMSSLSAVEQIMGSLAEPHPQAPPEPTPPKRDMPRR